MNKKVTNKKDIKDLTIEDKAISAIVQNNELDDVIKLQKFSALINKNAKSTLHDDAGNYDYIAIDVVQNELDRYFFGQWSTENFKWERVFNEIVASLELVIVHPISGRTLRRTGTASVVIQQKANTEIMDFDKHKRKNALELGFPKLKAECLKNAAKEFGKLFGRDLNRKFKDGFAPLIKEVQDVKDDYDEVPDNIITELNLCDTPIEVNAFWNKYPDWQANPNFTKIVKERQLKLSK